MWVSNNVGLHGTSAICTWKAKQACKISFRWRVSSESVSTDYLNITAAGTQILANTGGTTEQTGTLTATLAIGQTLVFTYRKDGSANNGQDRAEISEVKYGAGSANPTIVIYENNVEKYFTITNSTYGFYPGIPIANITVDTKGRITKEQTSYIVPSLKSIVGVITQNYINSLMVGATTNADNTAIGYGTLDKNTTGVSNTAVGYDALCNLTTYANCTGLGYNSQVTGSNQIQLGDSAVTVYAQKALVTRSDARDKLDIEDSPLGLNFILKLRPRKYRMNSREAYFEKDKERDFTAPNDGSKARKRPHYGLVAQEVKEVMNELGVDFAGYLDSKMDGGEDVLSLGYTEFIAPMIKAMQQQQAIIEQLQKEVEALKS